MAWTVVAAVCVLLGANEAHARAAETSQGALSSPSSHPDDRPGLSSPEIPNAGNGHRAKSSPRIGKSNPRGAPSAHGSAGGLPMDVRTSDATALPSRLWDILHSLAFARCFPPRAPPLV